MLVLDGLVKRYGSVAALDDCGFDARRGRIVGFLGPNGAGKTTAMRAVFALIRLDAGRVMWDGNAVTLSDRARFGYMPEERGLYPRSRVRRQLVYFAKLHGLSKREAEEAADLWLERFGLTDQGELPLKQLSKGNQQRVQLAVALAHNPELLVLDEPFSGLDPPGREDMAAILKQVAGRGAAVLFSSHELELVEGFSDDVVIINKGRVALAGRLNELQGRSPHRRLEISLDGDPGSLGALAELAARLGGAVKGAEMNDRGPQSVTVQVPASADLRMLLAAIPAEARIQSCVYTAPPLSELFSRALEARMPDEPTAEAAA